MAEDKKWAQRVNKEIERKGTKGKFREWCRQHGFSKVTMGCIEMGLKSKNKTVKKEAVLAKNFAEMRKRKKKG